MLRSDYRDLVIGKLANLSTNLPDIFSAEEMNSAFLSGLRSLPYKGLYLEQKWYKTLEVNVKEYGIPSTMVKVEKVQINQGTSDVENWCDERGWETFANVIHLARTPSSAQTMRLWGKFAFTEVTDDDTAVDLPDAKSEVLVMAMVRRLLDNLISYMIDSTNYDSMVKPSGATLPQVKGWRDEVRLEEERMIKSMQKNPRVREMNLVG